MNKNKDEKDRKVPTGFLKQIKKSLDAGETTEEGNISIFKIENNYVVSNNSESVHVGEDFRIAYDIYLKLVIQLKKS